MVEPSKAFSLRLRRVSGRAAEKVAEAPAAVQGSEFKVQGSGLVDRHAKPETRNQNPEL